MVMKINTNFVFSKNNLHDDRVVPIINNSPVAGRNEGIKTYNNKFIAILLYIFGKAVRLEDSSHHVYYVNKNSLKKWIGAIDATRQDPLSSSQLDTILLNVQAKTKPLKQPDDNPLQPDDQPKIKEPASTVNEASDEGVAQPQKKSGDPVDKDVAKEAAAAVIENADDKKAELEAIKKQEKIADMKKWQVSPEASQRLMNGYIAAIMRLQLFASVRKASPEQVQLDRQEMEQIIQNALGKGEPCVFHLSDLGLLQSGRRVGENDWVMVFGELLTAGKISAFRSLADIEGAFEVAQSDQGHKKMQESSEHFGPIMDKKQLKNIKLGEIGEKDKQDFVKLISGLIDLPKEAGFIRLSEVAHQILKFMESGASIREINLGQLQAQDPTMTMGEVEAALRILLFAKIIAGYQSTIMGFTVAVNSEELKEMEKGDKPVYEVNLVSKLTKLSKYRSIIAPVGLQIPEQLSYLDLFKIAEEVKKMCQADATGNHQDISLELVREKTGMKNLSMLELEAALRYLVIDFGIAGFFNDSEASEAAYRVVFKKPKNHLFSEHIRTWSDLSKVCSDLDELKPAPEHYTLEQKQIWEYVIGMIREEWLNTLVRDAKAVELNEAGHPNPLRYDSPDVVLVLNDMAKQQMIIAWNAFKDDGRVVLYVTDYMSKKYYEKQQIQLVFPQWKDKWNLEEDQSE